MSTKDKVNEVALQGKVFNVSDMRYTSEGKGMCNARMSVNRQFDGEWYSVWYSITAWGEEAAETLSRCEHGQDEVVVRGRLDVSKPWTNREGVSYDAGPAIFATSCERVGGPAAAPVRSTVPDDNDVPF